MNTEFDPNIEGKTEESVTQKKTKDNTKSKKIGKFFGVVFLACVFGLTASLVFFLSNKALNKLDNMGKKDTVVAEAQEEKTEPVKEIPKVDMTGSGKGFASLSDYNADNVQGGLTVTDVANEAMKSIVAITNKSIQEVRYLYGMGTQQYESESAGSGIIVGQNDTELLIVTNAHVVKGADTITVCFIDDEAYEAKLKGANDDDDIAVIAVSLSDLSGSTLDQIKVATIGSSDDLQIGEQVVAIGNAMGYGQSVTTGIVSALNRTMDGSDEGQNYIQTDAAINPGNSGGALLNMKGEVVGINSAKLASTMIEGMGYAIPISEADSIMETLMNMVTRSIVDDSESGVLGITGFSVTDEVSSAYNIPKGVYISEVTDGSAAEKAGIQKGDVITKFDGMSMDSINKLKERLQYYKAGETVEVTIARADDGEYRENTISATLDKRSELETNKSIASKSPENSDDDSADNDGSEEDDGQKNGEFSFGGSTFKYSIPNNPFNFFGN